MALVLEELAMASSSQVLASGPRRKLTRHYFRWTTPLCVAPPREVKALRAIDIEGVFSLMSGSEDYEEPSARAHARVSAKSSAPVAGDRSRAIMSAFLNQSASTKLNQDGTGNITVLARF
jgi:hypothetical protein